MEKQVIKGEKPGRATRSKFFKNIIFAGIVGLFLYILIVSYIQHQRYRELETKLQDTYAIPISESMVDAEHLYQLFGETDMIFRMYTLEFDNDSYFLYRKNLDSIRTFIDSIATLHIPNHTFQQSVQEGFDLRNRYALEFASLRKTLDDLILTNVNEQNPLSAAQANTRRPAASRTDTVTSKQLQDSDTQITSDTIVRQRESLFRRIFRAKNDTIVISNEQRNQIESERLEMMTSGAESAAARASAGPGAVALQSTFRALQEKEKQLILTNFELLDELKNTIDQLRALELASVRETEALNFQNYQSNFQGFQNQLIIAILLLIVLITAIFYYQKVIDRWEKQMLEETAYSTKLAAEKTTLLNNISHEIRTPLTALINITELLRQQEITPYDQESKKLADSVYYNIRVVNDIITDILSLSKMEEEGSDSLNIAFDYFFPARTVQQIAGIHESHAELKGIELNVRNTIDPRLKLYSNGFVIGQVLSGLVSNAIKYSNPGDTVQITSSLVQQKNSEALQIEVKDTGIGISETDIKQVFKKYYTVQHGNGFGLGLYLAKALVEELGGAIEATSVPGKGSTFRFTIPVSETQLASTEETKQLAPLEIGDSQIPAGLRVLIVDDNPINLLFIKRLLHRMDAVTLEAITVQSAQEILKKEQIDLVITDINLPGQSGWDLLSYIRHAEELKHISVYSTTASLGNPTTDGEVYFDGQLSKPFNEKDLIYLLQHYVSTR